MFRLPKGIASSLLPLFILIRITGFALFSLKNIHDQNKIAYFGFFNIITYILHTLFTTYSFFNSIQRFNTAPDPLRQVYAIVFFINAFALIAVNILWDKYHNSKFLQLLRKFQGMDRRLRKSGVHLNYDNLRNHAALVLLIEGSLYLYFNLDTSYVFWVSGLDRLTVILDFWYYAFLHAMQLTMTGKCFTLFAITKRIFDGLNSKMEAEAGSVKSLKKIRCLYHQTYDLVVQVNDVIAFQLVVPFCVTFVIAVYHIYYQIKDSSLQDSVTVLVWLSTLLIKNIVVIVQIHKTMISAKRIKHTAAKFALMKNPSLRREINMFSLQLLHEEINITGANIFKINVGLIGDFFGKGIQFLLILYQSYK